MLLPCMVCLTAQESRAREVARKAQVPAAEARAALLKEKQQEIGSGIAAAGSGTPTGSRCQLMTALVGALLSAALSAGMCFHSPVMNCKPVHSLQVGALC